MYNVMYILYPSREPSAPRAKALGNNILSAEDTASVYMYSACHHKCKKNFFWYTYFISGVCTVLYNNSFY